MQLSVLLTDIVALNLSAAVRTGSGLETGLVWEASLDGTLELSLAEPDLTDDEDEDDNETDGAELVREECSFCCELLRLLPGKQNSTV